MKIILKPLAAVALLCLSFQVGQVLAQKTARLSVSAIVTGNCSLRQASNDSNSSYSVTCSKGIQAPQASRLLPEVAVLTDAWARSTSATTGGTTARPQSTVLLVY